MIVSRAFAGKRYAVLGLARSGLAAVQALAASGASVTAWDSREEAREAVAGLAALADPLGLDLAGYDGVVVSPGVPLNRHPIKPHADAAGVPVIGDIELFALARPDLPPHRVVGITGTNGKSTTTALVHHIIKQAGIPTMMGGNIGLPILGQAPLPAGGIYVLELSSFQIDLTYSLDCDVAVLLNITPDHLDRYESFEAYRAAKVRLLDMQSPAHVAIVASRENGLDDAVMALATGAELTQWFGGSYETDFADEQPGWPALQGPHNAQNAWAARMTGLALGLSHEQVNRGLASYTSLPHRMEIVARRHGVTFVNDSKATNPASTAPALAAWPAIDGRPRIHWILGGLPKSDDLDACAGGFPNIAHAYTIGDAGPRFAELLRPLMPVTESELLVSAVADAARNAAPGDVVLLSPACASFDQFRDYEARGEAFKAAVAALGEVRA